MAEENDVAKNARRALLVAAAVFLVLPHVPLARMLLRPFTWLQTFAHELGHGVTATVLGGGWFTVTVHADGSGVTHHTGALGDVANGLVAAGGLVGPAFAAAFFFIAARRRKLSRVALLLLGALCVAAAALVLGNMFGRVVVAAWGVVFLVLGARLSGAHTQVVAAFAGVDLGMSVFSRGDYLFTRVAHTAEGDLASDVVAVAQSLGGFYLVWGVAIGIFSVLVVAAGLFGMLRSKR